MHRDLEHHQLCTLELIAEGHAGRCPGDQCAFWERGCALARLEAELDTRPEVAQLLLDLRREIEAGRKFPLDEARVWFSHILNVEEGIEQEGEAPALEHRGPAGGAMSPV
ncbi:MAG: hypothetical protein OEW31_00635 [Thermoleophilia bacterium]|nr:hypothetical protein [Thermoleophilia bacterium]MDH4344820.1 hypothetical protein [Thermoleophilia bacterium]MDH5333774.1 hypothetical protein [Thermoleophilia bacterium]